MITKKKDAMEQLQIYKTLLDSLIGKPCIIKFDMHESSGFIVSGIEIQTLKGMQIKPEKQMYEGKNKSPMLFVIHNNQCPLVFTFDNTTMVGLGNGVRIIVALDKPLNNKSTIEVDIRLEG